MKSVKLIFILLLLFVTLNAQEGPATGIKFEHSGWSEILAKAEAQNKLIFLDAYASWCGPCKWMAKNVFTNDTVAQYYNINFVNAKIDMEKGEGIEIAKKYGVAAYPTMLYINGKGELVHRTCGSAPVQQFVQQGMDANDPDKQLSSIKKKFETAPSNSVLARKYFKLLQDGCSTIGDDLTKYLDTQKESDLISKNNWEIINQFLDDYKTREFKYLLKNKNKFAALYTKDSVDQKIAYVYETGLRKYIRTKDLNGYNSLKKEIKKMGDSNGERIVLNSDLVLFQKNKEWKKYAETAVKLIEKFENNNFAALNSIAWTFYENVDDKELLEKAAQWAKKSTELSDQYFNNDTYAAVLYKLGRTNEAIAAAEKAIELAKKEGADYKETEDLLNKLKGI